MANPLLDLAVVTTDFGKSIVAQPTKAAAQALLGISDTPSGPSLGSTVTALGIAAGVVNVNPQLGDYFTLALTANVTSLNITPAVTNGRTLLFRIRQDATGARTLALPASFKPITGSDTAVQSDANAYTILAATSVDNGARWEYTMKAGAA